MTTRLKKSNIEQVRQALALFDEQGALDRLRSQATNAEQWDQVTAHHLSVFTGIDVIPGTIRHLRSEINIRWHESGEAEDSELFTPKERKALLIVSSEELGKLVDQAVERALNITRQPEATVEVQDIETPEPEQKEAEEVVVSCMVA